MLSHDEESDQLFVMSGQSRVIIEHAIWVLAKLVRKKGSWNHVRIGTRFMQSGLFCKTHVPHRYKILCG